MADVRASIAPILERVVNKLLKTKPEDPIGHMIHFLEQEAGKESDPISKEEKSELKELRSKYKALRKRKEEEEEEKSQSSESDDYVDDLPDEQLAKMRASSIRSGARTSVSSEAYGRYLSKDDFKPVVHSKSPEQKEQIKAKLEESFMFNSLEPKELNIILDAIKVVEFKAGETVIEQGDDGDVLYLIGNGTLDCFRKESDGEAKKIKTYEAGELFGELALLYNAPRAATIKSKENSTLFSLDRQTFNSIVRDVAAKKREVYEESLKKVKIMGSISAYERGQIADAVKQACYKKGDTIIREGDVGHEFYMIIDGEAKAMKGGSEVLKYKPGDYFGERSLMKGEPRAASIEVTSDALNVMILDRKSFTRMLGPIDEILMRNMENYKDFIE